MDPSKQGYKYQQLVSALERELHLQYAPGQKFPSELDLCARFNLNRLTIHRAVTMLAEKGLLIQKGRSGTYVADFDHAGYDNRLVCACMALRAHMWDRLYLALSYRSGLAEKFLLAVDLSDHSVPEWQDSRIGAAAVVGRLKHCLSWHPRSLVVDFDIREVHPRLGNAQWHFRNLVTLGDMALPDLPHVAQVKPDVAAGMELLVRAGLKAGYKRLCWFTLPWVVQACQEVCDKVCRGTPVEVRIFEDVPAAAANQTRQTPGLDALAAYVRQGEPAAVFTYFDYAAHIILERLRQQRTPVPEQVGLFGVGNTLWAIRDDLTSIAFDPDLWAAEVFRCLKKMEDSDDPIIVKIPPKLIERTSAPPIGQA